MSNASKQNVRPSAHPALASASGSDASIFQPSGTKWRDEKTGRMVMLVHGGTWDGWLCYQHPDGQWVSLRKVTPAEAEKIRTSILAQCEHQNNH